MLFGGFRNFIMLENGKAGCR